MNTTTQQPKPLRLADLIDANLAGAGDAEISSELRGLHAENEQLRQSLQAANYMLVKVSKAGATHARTAANLKAAVKRLHAARGRYHTQLAACDLFDLCGLPNERPKK